MKSAGTEWFASQVQRTCCLEYGRNKDPGSECAFSRCKIQGSVLDWWYTLKIVRTTQKIRVQARPWIESHIATRQSVLCRGTELISHTYLYNSLHMTRILLPEIVTRKWRHLLHVLSCWGAIWNRVLLDGLLRIYMRFWIHKAVFLGKLTVARRVQRDSPHFKGHNLTVAIPEMFELGHTLTPCWVTISEVDASLEVLPPTFCMHFVCSAQAYFSTVFSKD